MATILSVLEELSQLYRELRMTAFKGPLPEKTHDAAAAAEAVLRHQALMSAVAQAGARLAAITGGSDDGGLNAEECRRCREQAAVAYREARDLIERCRGYAALLESALASMRQNLGQMENGGRYLRSVKPASPSHPSFVDSIG